MAERDRRQPRVPVRLRVAWRGMPARFVTHTVDLSAGGVALELDKPLPEGTRCRMQLSLEGAPVDEVELLVEVVNVRQKLGRYFVGVRFCDLDERDTALPRLVEALLQAPEAESRRRHPRLRVRIPARDAENPDADWQVEDLSAGGLRLQRLSGRAPEQLEPGSVVRVRLAFYARTVELEARVVWLVPGALGSGPSVLGLAFEPPEDFLQLLAHLALGRDVPDSAELRLTDPGGPCGTDGEVA
ncbi:MAG: PilZ domain-containing protein [Myxococcales bacterium]